MYHIISILHFNRHISDYFYETCRLKCKIEIIFLNFIICGIYKLYAMNLLSLPDVCIRRIFDNLNVAQLSVLRATAKAFHPYIDNLIKSRKYHSTIIDWNTFMITSYKPDSRDWVEYNSFDIIKLIKKDCHLSSELAKRGNLEILKWVRDNGCTWWTFRSSQMGERKWMSMG